MKLLLLASAGGAIGAGARHLVNEAFAARGMISFPWATLVVNVVGSLLMGIVMALVLSKPGLSPEMRVFAATGILGGFTTFSSFSLDVWRLVTGPDGGSVAVFSYVLASVLVSVAALFLGMALARGVLS